MLVGLEQRAERELTVRQGKRGWAIHAVVYGAVMTALVILNFVLVARTDADFLWFPFLLLGWGIGLTMHYLRGVRWADRDIRGRRGQIDQQAGNPSSPRE